MTHNQEGFTFSEQIFTFSEQIRLVIVCDNKGEPHANYLQQLISRGKVQVESVIYTSKQYIANRPLLSSNQYLLFVGLSAATENHLDTVTEECKVQDGYMIYGWNGKTGVLYVDPSFKKLSWREIVLSMYLPTMIFFGDTMSLIQKKKNIERELYKKLVKKFYEKGLKSFMKLS